LIERQPTLFRGRFVCLPLLDAFGPVPRWGNGLGSEVEAGEAFVDFRDELLGVKQS
jgi:hypothetical protein